VQKAIRKIKNFLKNDRIVRGIFERYQLPLNFLDRVEICFAELPVSAKTQDCTIYINSVFLDDLKFSDEIHYIVHELCHWCQQLTGDPYDLVPPQTLDYLEIPAELEAFGFQIRFMRDFYGMDRAEEYLEDLLDFHGYEGNKREEKRRILLGE
jgi:hypothetical protein